ncbi:MAG: HEAT repeat domain-containing protein [Fimbriimonadaceae bacterium]|nr:HEAT repeat domain-containing protein [Fimbriimonadaceae bacterium]
MLLSLFLSGLIAGQETPTNKLTDAERSGVAEALYVGNMTIDDLAFERKPFTDPYRTNLITLALDKPLDAADALLDLHTEGKTGPLSRLIAVGLQKGLGDPWPVTLTGTVSQAPAAPLELPGPLQVPVVNLVVAVLEAQNQVKQATRGLNDAERRRLIDSLPKWAVEEPGVKFDFVTGTPGDQREILALVERVDLPRMRVAAVELTAAVEKAANLLRQTRVSLPSVLQVAVGGVRVEIGGAGNDEHRGGTADLIIDLGGDDRYTGRVGAGLDGVGVLLDLGGNDRYDLSDCSLGAGLLGIGLARDVGGNDIIRSKSLSCGAGLAGVGIFVKEGGDDLYDSVALSQGFGQLGIGFMLDTKGDDTYHLKVMGQGAGRTGGLGWLIDREGSDIYRAGGLILNSPLFKDVYYSFAQGFGDGYREDTGGISGGIGLITDFAGDDFYLAETYAQAASYWFAVGSLFDGSGHDTYTGYHYVQASAMHMCGAYLFDLAGDDGYIVKFGAAHAIGHDYGVALLLDRAGSDVYAARDSSPGIGNANGLGIFIEAAGEDRYQGPPGKGNPARGTGSLGVFADLSGQDLYRDGLADANAMVRDGWGVAYDLEDPRNVGTNHPTATEEQPKQAPPVPGSKPKPADTDLEALYRKATQWGVGTATQEVADAIRELIEIGMPALEWMIANRLPNASRLEQRAFVQVVAGIGEPARNTIALRVTSSNDNEARVALSVCLDGGIKEAGPVLSGALARPALQKLAVRTAGALGSKDAVNALLPLCASKDRLLALNAIVACAQIGSEEAYETAVALLRSPELPIRKAALTLLAKFPAKAIGTAKLVSSDGDERVARLGVELMGLVGTPEALAEAATKLLDPRPGMRIQAMLALNGRCPQANKAALLSLRTDPIPSVRAIAQRIDPGR